MSEKSGFFSEPSVEAHIFPDAQKDEFRHRLGMCLTAARSYDGTEPSYQSLFHLFEAFEQWERAAFLSYDPQPLPTRLSDETEAKLLRQYHPAIAAEARTISGLLTLAVKHCSDRFKRGDELLSNVRVQTLDGVLLPPGEGRRGVSEDGEPKRAFERESVFSPRLRLLLGKLQKRVSI